MPKQPLTRELLEQALARVPEGFLHRQTLGQRVHLREVTKELLAEITAGTTKQQNEYFYDSQRLRSEDLRTLARWFHPHFPEMTGGGDFLTQTIAERLEERNRRLALANDEELMRVLGYLSASRGYAFVTDLHKQSGDAEALQYLQRYGFVKRMHDLIYDPLRLGSGSAKRILRHQDLITVEKQIIDLLQEAPAQTLPLTELQRHFPAHQIAEVLSLGGLTAYDVQWQRGEKTRSAKWIRTRGADAEAAREHALKQSNISKSEAQRRKDERWQPLLRQAGDMLRPDARDAKTFRSQVMARTYTLAGAAKRLDVTQKVIQAALKAKALPGFTDPEGQTRIPAEAVEAAARDESIRARRIDAYETVSAREIALATGLSFASVQNRLQRRGIRKGEPLWGQVRSQWNLPDNLREFRALVAQQLPLYLAQREARQRAKEETWLREWQATQERERERREELRARLVAAFPAWRHEGRNEQQLIIHIGPPNSGKTHDALQTLTVAGSGWYLAPLRLLAFEVFDRLNQRGVPCNLLTGEEYIAVPGAKITAATIEMFNPQDSRRLVVIDEAHMLADRERGWAWTRALMEAQSPLIHIIAPSNAQELIVDLASGAGIPWRIVHHERLAPIRVASKPWTLDKLPPRTILVAFSRTTVLELKRILEEMRRTVCVVYGNLPPEVRRKQADRFASGKADICIATDAVGMGLNLPADAVCFYETEKYDGVATRSLTAAEVHQIGGRAGRYGLSKAGEIGATNYHDLDALRRLFELRPALLSKARVAPTVTDLEMIPGTLAERLRQWAELKSIPDNLRDKIQVADLAERIELAYMLEDREVETLGLTLALKLINAPTRQSTRMYWRACASAIVGNYALPLPPRAPASVSSDNDLERIESCIHSADVYLWLSQRPEFRPLADKVDEIRAERDLWAQIVDEALQQKIEARRYCSRCGRKLPRGHAFQICENCYRLSRFRR